MHNSNPTSILGEIQRSRNSEETLCILKFDIFLCILSFMNPKFKKSFILPLDNTGTFVSLNSDHLSRAYILLLFSIKVLPVLTFQGTITHLYSHCLFRFIHKIIGLNSSPFFTYISNFSGIIFISPEVCVLEIPLRNVRCGELYVLVYLKITFLSSVRPLLET